MSKKLLFNFNREVIQNYTYVKYVGTIITATNTLEKPIKSAILKGNTLEKLTYGVQLPITQNSVDFQVKGMESGKKYTIFYDVEATSSTNLPKVGIVGQAKENSVANWLIYQSNIPLGTGKVVLTMPSFYSISFLRIHKNDSLKEPITLNNLMLLEGDYTNDDIPFFDGIQSVKTPVLTTTGKDTLNPNEITFDSSSATNPESYTYSEGVYTFKNSRSNNQMRFTITKQNASDKILYEVLEVKDLNGNVTPYQIAMEGSNDKACWFSIVRPDWGNVGEVKIKLGVDSLEPYKSNILTVNEDVTLRSNGNICDELNLLTGELTQRIDEIVLDGSENWSRYKLYPVDGYTAFITTIPTLNNFYSGVQRTFISSDFSTGTWSDYMNNTISELVWNHDPNKIGIRVKTEKASTVEEIKAFLLANNIRIQYQLNTPSIKTVDLSILDQNENKVSSISSFNDTTHITASSGTIPPIFEGYLATKEG